MLAYVDPSVMSYTIQALAGLAIALGVVFGVFWRKAKRIVYRILGKDENADKECEPTVCRIEPTDTDKLAEAGAAALALQTRVTARLVRPDRPRLRAGLVAASLALYVALVLPLQTFVPNTSNYDFSIWALLPELLLAAVALFAISFALLYLGERFLKGWFTPLAVAILVAIYLDAGLLSLGIPELNGELPEELNAVGRKIWDLALLVGVLIAALGAFRWSKRAVGWVAIAVLLLGGASLLDLDADDRDTKGKGGESFGSFASADVLADNLVYSPKRNILMLVLDATPGTVASDILEKDPALAAHFPGFTDYRQNVGMHDRTERGVPGLFTGEYFDASQNMAAYMMTALGTNSFLRTYAAHGDAVYSMLDFFTYGLTTVPLGRAGAPRTPDSPVGGRAVAPRLAPASQLASLGGYPRPAYLFRNATEIPHLALSDVVAFRMVPFVAKGPLLRHDIHHRRWQANAAGNAFEHILYPKLAARPVADDPRQVFAKFHTHGAHSPFSYELDGSPWRQRPTELAGVEVATSNALVHVGWLLDAWRAKGIYDNAFIVVCADHGRTPSHPFPGNIRASALLMVKPEGASAPLAFSDAPTGHRNIARLMKTVCERPLTADEVTTLLSSEKRLYREYDRHEGKCHSWEYAPDGTARKVE